MTSFVKNSMPQFVWDDKPLGGAKELVRDDKRADRVVARAATGVANHLRIAFAQPAYWRGRAGHPCRVRIAKCSGGREGEFTLVSERANVLLVCGDDFVGGRASD